MAAVRDFMDRHFRHFNARETVDAARAWCELLDKGGEMLLSLAGAMSTGEIGLSLAELIREGKVHAISCTAANLEEDVFNLFGKRGYKMVPNYWDLKPEDERALRNDGLNRVTDTCIPEQVMVWSDSILLEMWQEALEKNEPKFPYEYMYGLLDRPECKGKNHVPLEDSWVLAAKERGLPILSPGWEDSTLGNMFCARVMEGKLKSHGAVRSGTEQMQLLTEWYLDRVERKVPVGFFQIGGGIAGDFAICSVPMIRQDMKRPVPYWAYFCQITDATCSYGGYSGAMPNEKITWHKLDVDTPKFVIQSDASIVAPLIFSYVLGK